MKSRLRVNTLEEFIGWVMVEGQILALRAGDQRLQDITAVCATDEVVAELTEIICARAKEAGIDNAFTDPQRNCNIVAPKT